MVTRLDPGTALLIVRHSDGWTMVDAPGGQLGWVPSDSLTLLRGG
jgi:hypothetical protein